MERLTLARAHMLAARPALPIYSAVDEADKKISRKLIRTCETGEKCVAILSMTYLAVTKFGLISMSLQAAIIGNDK